MNRQDASIASRYGTWAVIAGASEGLGEAFALAAAQQGLNVVLIARREALLDDLRTRITTAYGREVRNLVLDLSRDDRLEVISEQTADIDVGMLIYNAAHPVIGPFLDQPLSQHLRTTRVNCEAPVQLVHHFGRFMVTRGRGGIILMSSLAGFRGSGLIANYAATKAWNLCFAEALGFELRPHGIDVLACCAGAVRTPNYEASQPRARAALAPRVMEAGEVAAEALAALGTKPILIPGRGNRIAHAIMHRLLPRTVAVRIMGRTLGAMYGEETW